MKLQLQTVLCFEVGFFHCMNNFLNIIVICIPVMPVHSSYGLNVILPTTAQTGGDQFLPENALGLYF